LIDSKLDVALSQQWPNARRQFLGVKNSQSTTFEQRMGIGFIDAMDASLFNLKMRSIISDLVQTLDMAMYSSTCPSATEADVVWVHKKTTALAHRLLSADLVGRGCSRL
jgi:hypothetical protein